MSKVLIDRSVVEQALEALNPTASGNWTSTIALNAEAAIHALRAALEQPQVEREPYAWMSVGGTIWRHKTCADDVPLYTHPQPHRQPLTDEQLNCLWRQTLGEPHAPRKSAFDFARSIEAAHGIGGEA